MKRFYFTVLATLLALGASAQNSNNENPVAANVAANVVATEAATETAPEVAPVAASVATPVAAVDEVLTPNEARQRRGFSTDECFVPKGQWIFGGTASYSTHTNKDYKLVVVDDIDSKGYTVNVAPMVAYAVGKNMALGVRFGYGRTLLVLDNASVSVSGNDFSVDYFHRLKHSYTGTIFWRPYIPLGYSNRFAVFAEVQLNMSGGQSKVVAENGVIEGMQNYAGNYSQTFGASVALQPGIVAFVTDNTAIELSIGVFGIGVDHVTQVKNQIDGGKFMSSNANFKLNFLSVGFGVSFYL